jgi:hypothetical protein
VKKNTLLAISLCLFSNAFSQTATINHAKAEHISFRSDTQKKLYTQQTLSYEEALKAALASGNITSKIE